MEQQKVTFEEMFDHVKEDGIYLCEDLCTSYWPDWGGGFKNKNSFIEYSKNFIDFIHAFHSKDEDLKVNSFTRSADSVHYYDGIVVIEKRKRDKPQHEKTGKKSFNWYDKLKIKPKS